MRRILKPGRQAHMVNPVVQQQKVKVEQDRI